jgi:hybrid polyketide synthase/nonribosomal peptide synthetase ACE1
MSGYINEPIAIIGSSCRFAGSATSPSKLWELLKEPRDVLSKIDRFDADHFYHPDGHHHGTSNVRHAYMLAQDAKAFDASFFNIQAGEAESIDPQQRMMLETIYEGLEAAGLTLDSLQGSDTAMFSAVMCEDASGIAFHDNESIPKYAATGTARSMLANRMSYFFNWTGPSMTIDTACSSSLVAVHQAVVSLRSGESRIAVAAGTNIILSPRNFIAESNLNMLSPDGRSRMWDANANGYARGEGVASVILKTLTQALADGDSIECIIRETGVNQDGRTLGITMPSSDAQGALIRSTYRKAGLDLTKSSDRPQFFEAHGTGTKAGDPQEARAIYNAFFADTGIADEILNVGSIKTVVGHTEGTAGIAGLLKASLAIQNQTIPPNMLFETLNPDLKAYAQNLKVPTKALPWPALPAGTPRRASVNSFGFGGTNAHAIIEAYEAPEVKVSSAVAIPFTLSAPSEKALAMQLSTMTNFLRGNNDIDLSQMALTLAQRSTLTIRAAVSALTSESLAEKLEAKLEARKSNNTPLGNRAAKDSSNILGIFTGQGAQWAAMGRELILSSLFIEDIVDELEQSLAQLPESSRPEWSLKREMLAQCKESRIGEGLMSQPLCTAVQIILVNLLTKAGVTFSAVVGHSSGEIGAAYAAGFISAYDAIRIAYYRGFYAKFAEGTNGEKGSMLAVGTSMEDAEELCSLPSLEGRIQIAASNSSSSLTLSGDEDAVAEALEILKDENKFARQLKVDTAYHSHHMIPCSDKYLASLEECNVQILSPPENAPRWFSSVYGGDQMTEDNDYLTGQYWAENMLQPVLFSQALTAALDEAGPPAFAMEVGPHPALKGPATATIEEVIGNAVPYTGTLSRNGNDVETLAETLGFIWTYLGPATPNFKAYNALFGNVGQKIMKNLPQYTWDHDRTYWYESRISRLFRAQRPQASHEILGIRMDSELEGEYRWHNFLKPSEISWLRGHTVQGQVLFPAAGFVALAVEGSKTITADEPVALIELHDFSIHNALAIADETYGAEIISSIKSIVREDNVITAQFSCDACMNRDTGSMSSMSTGKLVIRIGEQSQSALPIRPTPEHELRKVNVENQYASFQDIGYNYNGIFKAITSLKRTTNLAMGKILVPEDVDGSDASFTVHPAVLDVGLQVTLCAIGAPFDSRLWTLHVPTVIRRIKINPMACPAEGGRGSEVLANSVLAKQEPGDHGFTGDLSIYDPTGSHCFVQLEGVRVEALARPNKATDRHMFAESAWSVLEPDAKICFEGTSETDSQKSLCMLVERACFFYLKQLWETITPEEREQCDGDRLAILNWAEHLVSTTTEGSHSHLEPEWVNDTEASLKPQLLVAAQTYDDMRKVMFAGEMLIPFVRNRVNMLEEFKNHNLLDWFYKSSTEIANYNACMGAVVKQLTHRFPYMNILEIGAGTGSATQSIINEIGQSYSSYTYTDISAGFLHDAAELFKDHGNGFTYKVLDIEQDVVEQGYTEGTYDCVVASNVLHATKSLEHTLNNARKLLRPGGYLVMLEITQVDWLRTGLFFSCIPGWWAGVEDGRPYTPLATEAQWDSVFRRTGFSGIDTVTPSSKTIMGPYSVMVTQALDTRMEIIRAPLASAPEKQLCEKLLIVGGEKPSTLYIAHEVQALLLPYYGSISIVSKLQDVGQHNFSAKDALLSLTELDEPLFKSFSEEKYQAMQFVLDEARNVLWTVQGSKTQNPYARMMMAVARCLAGERRDALYMQTIDSIIDELPQPRLLAETMLRMHIAEQWRNAAYEPLWCLERELHVSNGVLEVERFVPSTELDDRYNSDKREIKKAMPLSSTVVAVSQVKSAYQLREVFDLPFQREAIESAEMVTINVRKSFISAVKVKSVGSLFIVFGTHAKTGKKLLAFSQILQSSVSVPQTWTIECDVADELESNVVLAAATYSAADAIVGKTSSRSSCLVHEAIPLLARTLIKVAAERKVPMFLTSSKSSDSMYHYIHPSTSQALIASQIPQAVTVFADLSGSSTEHDALGHRIARDLPAACKRREALAIFSNDGNVDSEVDIKKTLRKHYVRAMSDLGSFQNSEVISLANLPDTPVQPASLRVIDWTAEASVPVSTSLVNEQLRFRSDGTYWMVGATGELGLSTCQWMVNRGARNFALTSRSPKVERAWLDAMATQGVTVKILAMDVTSRDSVRAGYKEICDTMPRIAGVTNAAMVLDDNLLANMPYESFAKTLKPKVDGTIFLDELFPENTLDFFIVYSSLAYIAGNHGQCPYAAANGFMTALAANRRERGLAGSAMSFGAISGVGYVERRSVDINLSQKMSNLGYAPVSEWDYHQFFAEAVLASPSDSGRNFEISSGCKVFDVAKEPNLPYWLDLPKFAYYRRVKADAFTEQSDKRQVSVRAQLKEQTTEEGVQKVLLDRFISGLCTMLHISEDESRVSPETGLTELGIDSLVAVEIRSWFQSELDLDMPVLKILSGASIEKMVEDAFERLSPELTPEFKREGAVVEVEAVQEKVALSEENYQSETLLSSANGSDTSSSDGEEA